MRIAMIGTGYVGLVTGTCFTEFGIDVVCIDKDEKKVETLRKGVCTIYEPGLEDILQRQLEAGRISFTTDIKEGIKDCDVVFICVGTPSSDETGHADLSYVYQAAREIANAIEGYTVIVTKSTVPVGTAREIEALMKEENPHADFDIASNPEFLREGAAVNDFMRPDRIVIGTNTPRAEAVLKELYRPLQVNDTPVLFTNRETAEIIKYASNAFLATKITFINEIANLCEETDGNVLDVAKAMGLDDRIGSKFLRAGPGYGGSCFPKDMMALSRTGQKVHTPLNIVEAVIKTNSKRQHEMVDKIVKACDGDLEGKTIGVLGISFKPNTDDIRGASSLVIIPELQKRGAKIKAYDPAAIEHAKPYLNDVAWEDNAYSVAEDADALVLLTEWNQFKALKLQIIGELMKVKRLIDLRNVYGVDEMEKLGFHYVSVGRPEIRPRELHVIKDASNQ